MRLATLSAICSLYLWLVHWFSEHYKITHNQFDVSVGHLFLLVTFL